MTQPMNYVPDLISTGTQAMVENANRLGITWRLRQATVTSLINENAFEVIFDGDEARVRVVSMIGHMALGERVYVITLPPSGNYAVGWVSARYPGERIATVIRTSTSAGFTAETEIDTITAKLIANRTYLVKWYGRVQSTVADGYCRARIREDSSVGNVLTTEQVPTTIAVSQSQRLTMEVEFTPTTDQIKTFSIVALRNAGTGTLTSFAAANAPIYTSVSYVRG